MKNVCKRWSAVVLALLLTLPTAALAAESEKVPSLEEAALTAIEAARTYGAAESIQYALWQDGGIVLTGHSGSYSREENRALTDDILYGIGSVASGEGMAQLSGILAGTGFGAVNAFSMMLFCLLYIPCAATIAAIRRESHSVKWTLGSVALQLGVAWLVSTVFYQIALLIL